ncbi:MAG: DUF4364 family protein [Christensenellaceae bacterium]|jgi:hypothetical protein|nr:DUF4364 family protein [Christensenellaceae bacterium]
MFGRIILVQNTEDNVYTKILILYIFDAFGFPVTEETLLDFTSVNHNYISSLLCKSALEDNKGHEYIREIKPTMPRRDKFSLFELTEKGRQCLDCFFDKIPKSVRSEIMQLIQRDQHNYKRLQEYRAEYSKNPDGSFCVSLKIYDGIILLSDLKIRVDKQATATSLKNSWLVNAPIIYQKINELIYDF